MILVRVENLTIVTETGFARVIVLLVEFLAGPVTMALNPEMVVGSSCQVGVSIGRLKARLCKSYARRYTVGMHGLDSQVLVLFYILGSCQLLSIH